MTSPEVKFHMLQSPFCPEVNQVLPAIKQIREAMNAFDRIDDKIEEQLVIFKRVIQEEVEAGNIEAFEGIDEILEVGKTMAEAGQGETPVGMFNLPDGSPLVIRLTEQGKELAKEMGVAPNTLIGLRILSKFSKSGAMDGIDYKILTERGDMDSGGERGTRISMMETLSSLLSSLDNEEESE